jgi:hypothetical protein
LGLGLAGARWRRIMRARHHYVQHRRKRHRPHGPRQEPIEMLGEALTGLGPRQVTVRGRPARLRLVVIVPAAAEAGPMPPESHGGILDAAVPGLGEIIGFDFPRVENWPGPHTHDSFRAALEGRFTTPGEAPSRWCLLAGEASAPQGAVHVGLAVHTDQPIDTRSIDVPPGQWASVLAVREVPKADQGW